MQKKIILIVLLSMVVCHVLGASLPRRAFLGTQLYGVTDSVAARYGLPEARGALIDRVVDNSSAAAMGLQPGDVIVSVMGQPIIHHSDVASMITSLRGGDVVEIGYYRHGTLLLAEGVLLPLPYETSPYADVIYDAVPWEGGYVRTIIRKPRAEGKFPVLFFIQGAHCGSMDRMDPNDPVARLIEGFARLGYVVVKTEKAGVGDSRTAASCSSCNLQQEVALFSASFNHLAQYDFVDTRNVFVLGHSMGGIQAPLLQTDFAPRGIAVFGTVVRPWFEYFMEIVRKQRLLLGQDYLENERIAHDALRFFYALMVEKKTPHEMMEDEQIRGFMLNQWSFDGAENFHGRHYTFWQQLQDARLFEAWANTQAHVLSIWGEGEFVAINPYEHQLITDIVNHYNPGKARFVRMPNINHGFVWVEDVQHAIAVRNDWQYQYSHFNEDIVVWVHDWMQEVMGE